MADGTLDELFPPGNIGLDQGVGMISGNDGKNYVFQTPNDNNSQPLTKGNPISFVVLNGKHIESVTQTSDNPLGGA